MTGGGILVDRRGRAAPAPPSEVAERLAAGAIHLRRSPGGARLAAVPGTFTQCALLGAMLALERVPDRIVVSLLEDGAWRHEIFEDQAALVHHLEALAQDPPTGPRPPWIASRLRLDALEEFRPLLGLWRERRGRLPKDLPGRLGTRGILVRHQRGHWRFESVPTSTVIMRPCEWLERIGQRIEDQPDPGYWAWAARNYDAVVVRETPRLDLVRATVSAIDGATIRTRYHRLSLPWRSGGGDDYVSVISIRRGLDVAPPAPRRRAR